MSKRRVVVTGLGLLTPVGNNVEESWKNIVAGKSGIAAITAFDASQFSTRISGSVKDFDASLYLAPKDLKKMDTFIHFGLAAGIQALDDAGIEVSDANAERIGVAIGSDQRDGQRGRWPIGQVEPEEDFVVQLTRHSLLGTRRKRGLREHLDAALPDIVGLVEFDDGIGRINGNGERCLAGCIFVIGSNTTAPTVSGPSRRITFSIS